MTRAEAQRKIHEMRKVRLLPEDATAMEDIAFYVMYDGAPLSLKQEHDLNDIYNRYGDYRTKSA